MEKLIPHMKLSGKKQGLLKGTISEPNLYLVRWYLISQKSKVIRNLIPKPTLFYA